MGVSGDEDEPGRARPAWGSLEHRDRFHETLQQLCGGSSGSVRRERMAGFQSGLCPLWQLRRT